MSLPDLAQQERKLSSQNGEAGVLAAIFPAIGSTNRYCIEFGCGNAVECNSAFFFEQGWRGLLMDPGSTSRNPWIAVQREFITAENINTLFRKYDVPQHFDFLSIDIDGNDYWVWQALTFRPRVVVIEYNAHIPALERRSIAYEPHFRWNGSDYYGASLRALQELGQRKGYTLVYCESTGTNAFFIATDQLPSSFVPQPLEMLFRPPNFLGRGIRHPRDRTRVMIDPTPELVDPLPTSMPNTP